MSTLLGGARRRRTRGCRREGEPVRDAPARRYRCPLCSIALTATAVAHADWGAVTDLSATGQDATSQQVATNASGTAVAVWLRSNGTHNLVQTARSTDSGVTWGSASSLSASGASAIGPQVAIDASGNAVIVWYRSNGTKTVVQEAHSSNGGSTWSSPADLSDSAQHATGAQVAVVSGVAVAVWSRSNATKTVIQAKRSTDGGATWSASADLSDSAQHAVDPQVAIDSSGNAIAVWERSNATNQIVQTARYTSSWSAVSDLSASAQDAYDPQLALTADGVAMAVWYRSNGTNTIVQASRYSGSWGSVANLSATAQDAQVAMDGSGNAFAVWIRSNGTNTIVQTARYAGSWGSASDLSAAAQDGEAPQVAADTSGNAVAVWYRSNGANQIVQAARYASGWGSAENQSASGQGAFDPQVAAGPSGSAIVVWYRSNGTNTIVQAVRFTVPESAAAPPPPPPRAGYCLKGRFLDLERDQPEIDKPYLRATPALFVHGKGITCDPPPAGYHLSGTAPESLHVPRDLYPYWVKTAS